MDKYNCHIVLNYDGEHLEDLRKPNTNFCNVTVHKIFKDEYEKFYENIQDCSSTTACIQVDYSTDVVGILKIFKLNKIPPTTVKISYKNPMVRYQTDFINYDGHSFVGEVGGTLGLTIGWSFLSISEWIIDFLKLIITMI